MNKFNNPKPKTKTKVGSYTPHYYPIKSIQKLERPKELDSKEFLRVLESRRSSIGFSSIDINEVSQLLFLCTKIQSLELDDHGYMLTKRTTPSAGARHPIDMLVSNSVKDNLRTLSLYNPINHSLGELELNGTLLHEFFGEVAENLPVENACIIWFSMDVQKTAAKYDHPESLLWRDAGALLYCIQIMATFLGLNSCPVGTLAETSYNKLFESKHLISGGGVIISKT